MLSLSFVESTLRAGGMLIVADSKSKNPVTIELASPGEDRELKAIAYIRSILDCLPLETQYRVLNYCYERLPPIGTEKPQLGKGPPVLRTITSEQLAEYELRAVMAERKRIATMIEGMVFAPSDTSGDLILDRDTLNAIARVIRKLGKGPVPGCTRYAERPQGAARLLEPAGTAGRLIGR